MQHKDIIYIDVEDDITSIIGKVKKSNEKIVALVPPKRTSILQSAVNLRLLSRTAENAGKRLVIVSNSAALASLAAAADIPVAKNLQSKPQVADVPATEASQEEVIEGSQLPIGEHADAADSKKNNDEDVSIDGIDIDGEKIPTATSRVSVGKSELSSNSKRSIKVPDFGSFRKRFVLGISLGVATVLFLYWALAIAPHATIVVSARTTEQALSVPVTLGQDILTSAEKATIKTIKQSEKDVRSIDFTATGTKDVGEKAKGEVTFSTNLVSLIGTTIPSGTNIVTSSGLVFVTTQNVTFTFPGGTTKTSSIVAAASGTKYNGAKGMVSGVPSGVAAEIADATTGGTEKIIKIVSQADIDKAQEQFTETNKDAIRKKLKDKFPAGSVVISDSFLGSDNKPVSSPAVGQEAADGKAKLSSEVTYTMLAVAKDELDAYLDDAFEKILNKKSEQRVYDNGLGSVKFEDFKAGEKIDTASITTTAKIGPKINEGNIKQEVKGKRSGEVIGDLKSIDGISDVEVKLSPFWVQGVPDDIKKISIEFKLKDNG